MVEMIEVVSSNVNAVGYDKKTKEMFVEFKGINVYTYYDVPEETFNALVDAPSVGKYLNVHIKGTFKYLKGE